MTSSTAPATARDGTSRRKILLIDDHPLLRKGLSALINQEPDLMVSAEAEDGPGALKLLENGTFDMAIVDISLPGVDGIEVLKMIKARHPELPALVVTMHDESLFAERALRAGARGFVMKQEAVESILTAIRRVLGGQIYVSDRLATRVLEKLADGESRGSARSLEVLSDRELTIFTLIGQGYGTRQIADQLHLSVKTVESHRAHIKEKLQLSSGTELVRYACLWVGASA